MNKGGLKMQSGRFRVKLHFYGRKSATDFFIWILSA